MSRRVHVLFLPASNTPLFRFGVPTNLLSDCTSDLCTGCGTVAETAGSDTFFAAHVTAPAILSCLLSDFLSTYECPESLSFPVRATAPPSATTFATSPPLLQTDAFVAFISVPGSFSKLRSDLRFISDCLPLLRTKMFIASVLIVSVPCFDCLASFVVRLVAAAISPTTASTHDLADPNSPAAVDRDPLPSSRDSTHVPLISSSKPISFDFRSGARRTFR